MSNIRVSEAQDIARAWPLVEASVERIQRRHSTQSTPRIPPQFRKLPATAQRLVDLGVGASAVLYMAGYPRVWIGMAAEHGGAFAAHQLGDNAWRVERTA